MRIHKLTMIANAQSKVLVDEPHQAESFRCPECGAEVYPQNVLEITCECGAEGNKQHFSSVERRAA